jgi:hypothetical protein
MLQPFELFKPMYIPKLRQLKKRYIVTQSYKRRSDHLADILKIDILLSDYDELGGAKIHVNAVKGDKYAAILDLENEKHLKKLNEMLAEGSEYRLYWAIVKSAKDLQERVNKVYRDNMKRYIQKHTNWRISGDTTLYPSVQISFGELFIILKYGNQTLRIKFEEIETV